MIIVGAGLSGLIAANYFKTEKDLLVIEAQETLPNNHSAILRFRTDAVSNATNIKFKKVRVYKCIVSNLQYVDKPNPWVANQYSMKVNNCILPRSIWNVDPVDRFIAPQDFIQRLANNVNIQYGINFIERGKYRGDNEPIISTIPMPTMMKIMEWKHIPDFQYRHVFTYNCKIFHPHCDVYQTIYYPELGNPIYRASITGNDLTIESLSTEGLKENAAEVIEDFGLEDCKFSQPTIKRQKYGKIQPIDEDIRHQFMWWLTTEHGIYSVGRFATWRQILLDDIIKDLGIIRELIIANDYKKVRTQV